MARNNLILNNEWSKAFCSLPDEKAGQLIKAIFAVHEGKEADSDDPVLSAVINMFGAVVIERREAYEETCRRNKESGSKGGMAKASNRKQALASASERKRDVANRIEKEKNKKNIKENNKKKSPFGLCSNVMLTDEEHAKLVSEFGLAVTARAISFLDAYIAEKGYKSRSHYLAIRRWVLDAITKQKPPNKGTKFQNFPVNEENRGLSAQIIEMYGGKG